MYLVIIQNVVGGHMKTTQTVVKEFKTKQELSSYLANSGSSGLSIRVFEANEMNFKINVDLTKKSEYIDVNSMSDHYFR
jgi:hypothetical protein